MKETKEMFPSWSDDHGVRLGNVKIKDLHDFKEHPLSFVEVTVAIITEETSGAGNGTSCSQLNIVISVVEAMYLFEGMWLFSILS